ncbi:septum formation family protein [Nocardioides flavescens]|uniref:septum formation family protein n=1 Tax=Nocardioides flavescens TaxID=2691959 RepID=UPI00301DB7F7
MRAEHPHRAALAAVLALVGAASTGCGLFGGDDGDGQDVSVFSVDVGDCFEAPSDVEAQISDLRRVPCERPHDRELYAREAYVPAGSAPSGASGDASGSPSADASAPVDSSGYPGDDALTAYAEATCAQAFAGYVGVDYLDSSLFFTYLVPSPRSWEDDDRSVLCFVGAAGTPLEGSVKGTKR